MYVKSALRKAGLKDEALLQDICAMVIPNLQENDVPKTVRVPFKQHFGGETLGVVKIAYEMAHYWLGDDWLTDPFAVDMRKSIKGDRTVKGAFRIYEDQADGIQTDNYSAKEHHVLLLIEVDNALLVNVRLLDVFSAYYLVSRNAHKYQLPDKDVVFMNVVTKEPFFLKKVVSTATTGIRLAMSGEFNEEASAR